MEYLYYILIIIVVLILFYLFYKFVFEKMVTVQNLNCSEFCKMYNGDRYLQCRAKCSGTDYFPSRPERGYF